MSNIEHQKHLAAALEGARQEAQDVAGEVVSLSIMPRLGATLVMVRIGLETYNALAKGSGKEALEELREGIIAAANQYAAS